MSTQPRTTLITGGGSGIGLRLAELLAARGDHLAILDRQMPSAALDRLERATAGKGGLEVIEADVSDAAAVTAACARATAAVGPPRLVINSAGVQLAKRFTDLSEDDFRRVIDINLLGSRNVAAATWPGLTGGGHLVLIASLAGLVANYGYAAYCASKHGVVGLAGVLRLEGRPQGVHVSCVCPPEVETPMVEEERRNALAPTEALKAMAGTMDLDPAARAILDGIDRREFLIVPSRRAKAARLSAQLLPSRLAHAVTDRVVARALR
jgi:NAD(P)-dependent dehydrogenase (short-subunit alcohol dehydrogenase family)